MASLPLDPKILRFLDASATLSRKAGENVEIASRAIENPINRERVMFIRTAAETGGELLQMESRLQPGGFVGAEHIHPVQESRFYVVEGHPSFRVDGRSFVLNPDDTLVVPSRTPHKFWNESEREIRMLIEFRPALRTQQFFEVFFGLSRDGLTDGECAKNLFQRAVLCDAYFWESQPVGTHPLRFRARTWLAPVGRLLGYRAWYPEYAGVDPDPVPDPVDTERRRLERAG